MSYNVPPSVVTSIQDIFMLTPIDSILCDRSYSSDGTFAEVSSAERYARHQQIVIANSDLMDIRWNNRCTFKIQFYRRSNGGYVKCEPHEVTVGAHARLLSRLRRQLNANIQYLGHVL